MAVVRLVLQHLSGEQEKALQQIRERIREGGRVIVLDVDDVSDLICFCFVFSFCYFKKGMA